MSCLIFAWSWVWPGDDSETDRIQSSFKIVLGCLWLQGATLTARGYQIASVVQPWPRFPSNFFCSKPAVHHLLTESSEGWLRWLWHAGVCLGVLVLSLNCHRSGTFRRLQLSPSSHSPSASLCRFQGLVMKEIWLGSSRWFVKDCFKSFVNKLLSIPIPTQTIL